MTDNTAKKAALYLVKRYSGPSNHEIGRFFGGMHYSAVNKSSARFERQMEDDGQLRTLVEALMSNVKA